MRKTAATIVALALYLVCLHAQAFEIENRKLFEAENESTRLSILSSTDLEYFEPLIRQYQSANSRLSVDYTVASSAEIFKAVYEEQQTFDLVISSAMDLQMKLVNDGFGQSYRSAETTGLPSWAKWRDLLFAFSQEPAVLLASAKGLSGLDLPDNRQKLIALLRKDPERFRGKIGTYDLRVSGAGYLFATQDVRQSEAFWQLTEVMGALSPKLYCCSSSMINDLESGEILLAYNVFGSYAAAGLSDQQDRQIVPMLDFTHLMLRTAMIPGVSKNPADAGDFIDFLLSATGRELLSVEAQLPPVSSGSVAESPHLQPINLGPGLLVYLDKIKRKRFLKQWTDAMVRPE